MAGLDDLVGEKYLSLETYRRTGAGVRTPVWFAAEADGARLFVYSTSDSGKAKRIRRWGEVRVAACTAGGRITGAWIEGHARLVAGEEFDRGMRLLNRKYWPWKAILDLFAGLRRRTPRVMIEIRV